MPASSVDIPEQIHSKNTRSNSNKMRTSLLTGGADKPYSLALAAALTEKGIRLDFIGSNEVSSPELIRNPDVEFLNLRGDQSKHASLPRKCLRILFYYAKLIRYAATAKPRIFHILWNNKIEYFDRTLLLFYYRLLRKKILFTAHNVNAGKRDGTDSWFNRLTLACQYKMVHRIFVHTEKMKTELSHDFRIPAEKVVVIPFGINVTVPNTDIASEEARKKLGFGANQRILLFFGYIAPYKGLEYLVDAFALLSGQDRQLHLVIAGKPKDCEPYWQQIQHKLDMHGIRPLVTLKTDYVSDGDVELYFKAADALVLPYKFIFQSGVLFLSYSFGLPVIAADVGSLKEDIIEGKTGFIFRARDPVHLSAIIRNYFKSELYRHLDEHRGNIRQYAGDRYSWSKVGTITCEAYDSLLAKKEKSPKAII
jgi:D-inositol-3-phosphate glycosyltransferase